MEFCALPWKTPRRTHTVGRDLALGKPLAPPVAPGISLPRRLAGLSILTPSGERGSSACAGPQQETCPCCPEGNVGTTPGGKKKAQTNARSPISLSATLISHTPRSMGAVEPWEASAVGSHTESPRRPAALLVDACFAPTAVVQCDPLNARHRARGPLTIAVLLCFAPYSVHSSVELHQTPPKPVFFW